MAEFDRNIGEQEPTAFHFVENTETQLTMFPADIFQLGPKVHELKYKAGGHGTLVEQAKLAEGGKLKLSREDLHDPVKVPLIHPLWRDELMKGNELVVLDWGKMEVNRPKVGEVVLFEPKE